MGTNGVINGCLEHTTVVYNGNCSIVRLQIYFLRGYNSKRHITLLVVGIDWISNSVTGQYTYPLCAHFRERRCIHKQAFKPGRTTTPCSDTPSSSYTLSEKKQKRTGRPPKRFQLPSSPSRSSFGDESDVSQDSLGIQEADFVVDSQDILVETDLTNKPLSELLRVSTRSKQAAAIATPAPPSTAVSVVRNACYVLNS